MTTTTGGPAFPLFTPKTHEAVSDKGLIPGNEDFTMGMTLRDYFAAKAMQSMLLTVRREQDVDIISRAAYRMADDMLKARQA